MRLLSLFAVRNLSFQLIAAGLLAVVLVNPASAERANHGTTPLAEAVEPSRLAGPQNDETRVTPQPQPVYPDGDPDIETVESDDLDEAVEPSNPAILVTIDKGDQEMTVWVDGVETHTWPVSTGIGGYSTPSGNFTASSMNKIWYSRQWDNAPMPHAIFFTKRGHAIHATNDTRHLGSPASHGCVRLSPKNAATLFTLVKKAGLENTQVVLTGVTPGGEYKLANPRLRQPKYPAYPGRGRGGFFDQYGTYEGAPPVRRAQRRRLFQPYYEAPPRQQPQQRQRRDRRWFRSN